MTKRMHINYFIEGERVCSKIGGGFGPAPYYPINNPISFLNGGYEDVQQDLYNMVSRSIECTQYGGSFYISENLDPVHNEENNFEDLQYFYHPDHLGSSSFITDATGYAVQHLQYLPFGETFVDQQNGYDSRYTFSAKEKDDETQYSYFGARYYDSDISIWLSVDPLSDKYPSLSPYMYCAGNPVILSDPDGREPIKPMVGTIEGFMSFFNSLGSNISKTKSIFAHCAMLRMGQVTWTWSGPKPKNTGPFNKSNGNRYIYTKKGGWIDMAHFMFYAGKAYQAKVDQLYAKDLMSETSFALMDNFSQLAIIKTAFQSPIGEAMQDGYMQEYMDKYSASYSAYSYEDLPSDYYGADFAVNYFNPFSKLSFGEQLQNYFVNVLKATDPTQAPNYDELPTEYPNEGELPTIQNFSSTPLFTSE